MLTDLDTVREAQDLRDHVIELLISKWEKTQFKKIHHDSKDDEARRILAKLVNCYDTDLMFYSKFALTPISKKVGVEPHVLKALRTLAGPHGYAIYKAMKINQKE